MSGGAVSRFHDRYLLVDLLGGSSRAQVWRASDEELDRPVAVKILRSSWCGTDALVPAVRARVPAVIGLSHSGIAATYDYGETRLSMDEDRQVPVGDRDGEEVAYLVTELVPGDALSSVLARGGRLDVDVTTDLIAQAALALHVAHQSGVVHGNVRPGNLMVTPQGQVKVTDFAVPSETAHYLAPELARGDHPSPRSDVYALGVVAYECLVGHPPFGDDNQVALALAQLTQQPPPMPDTIPSRLRALVDAAMAKDSQRRIPDAGTFAAALEDLPSRS
jgi:eukaryotic-like serine/threonine-protein kinase